MIREAKEKAAQIDGPSPLLRRSNKFSALFPHLQKNTFSGKQKMPLYQRFKLI
ncbi:hypothetical protein [Limosilactobacillus pontis]|uniref:hypothetical protein n=1 Tax=Limosilactobacillus pontis TaxID=35787 RepID=UPI002F269074